MIDFGTPHRHLAVCGSTNDAARVWAMDGVDPAPSGALVTAEFQTQGRGQRGRDWQAGLGVSALMSFVYRPAAGLVISQLGLVTALAVAEALEGGTSLSARIKWPNDILLDEHKTAGILVETSGRIAIIGIGINVNQERFEGAEAFRYPPTSLRLATGQPQEITPVIEAVSAALGRWEARWEHEGFAPILVACRRRLAVGAVVRRGDETATLLDLSETGSASVRLPDGTLADWATVDS